ANTDADSVVEPDWLVHQLDHAESGAHVVAGTVSPDVDGATLRRWRAEHDAGDGHPHVHGANLGIRGDALVSLGGWPAFATGEDVELVARASAAGFAVVRTGRHPVRTSARRVGRAPKGFSSYLAALDER
ncbi:hypothetical protein, partial [Jatrophihabitans endophyticus]|uniref:glycosyltransferase n=1 Tax=Jatrophihabitans endophyticus TaxID=1206085 RepID=UPI0019E4BAB0